MNLLNKNFLANELVKWRDSGLIDRITADKIAANYDIDLQNLTDKKSLILKLVAYLFFALSLITLVGANWEEIPRFIRLLMVLGVLAFVNLSGLWTLKKGNQPQATALFFLGNFCYGAAIAMVAQIYNLGEHMPNGVLLWAVGAFVLSLATQRSVLATQSLVIALIWFLMEIQIKISYEFIAFIAVSLYMLWREESRSLVIAIFVSIFIYLISYMLHSNVLFSSFWYIENHRLVLLSLGYSLFGVAVSFVIESFGRFSTAKELKNISIITGILTLLMAINFNFYGFLEFGYQRFADMFVFYGGFYGALYIAFVAISLGIMVKFKRFYVVALCLLAAILPLVVAITLDYVAAIYSLLSVIVGVVLIKQDYLKSGLCIIFLVAIVRYMELVGDYIGGSLLFLVFAVTVLTIAKKRRAK